MKISLAPMQGYTDAIFRTAINKIGGIDAFYAPYMKIENNAISAKYLNDISIERNNGLNLIPQILTNKTEELLLAANVVANLGYTELNWNLGCPYPMVTKRCMGAGLLPFPNEIDKILSEFENKSNINLSIKIRLGLESEDEIWKVLNILNQHKISEIIIHPRIARQMYKGIANRTIISTIIEKSANPIAYNGDILNTTDAEQIITENKQLTHLMIGRGLLYNPFLANELKGTKTDAYQRRSKLQNFTENIAQQQLTRLQGAGHFLQKMTTYWEYWSQMFVNQHKIFKSIKKCHSTADYEYVTQNIFRNAEMAQ